MVIRRPFPGLTATLWGEPGRYARDYWQRIPGQNLYFSGDAAAFDDDGYPWFSGRADEIIKELLATVRYELGPVAVIGEINFVSSLPKTRSGKIMRRVLRAVTLGHDLGDVSTIEDDSTVSEARQAWQAMRCEIGYHARTASHEAP